MADCYDGMNRYLPTLAYSDPDNTPTKCIDACQGLGKSYAGLQYGNECWCGDKLAGPPTKPQECDHRVSPKYAGSRVPTDGSASMETSAEGHAGTTSGRRFASPDTRRGGSWHVASLTFTTFSTPDRGHWLIFFASITITLLYACTPYNALSLMYVSVCSALMHL